MADKTVRGRFVWHELMTPDAPAAHAFYTKVLGWKTQPWEQDPSYTMFAAPSGPLGGTWSQESAEPRWITYIGTDDIEGTVRQAQELGGRVTKEITSMPNGGQYALLKDPQGAPFGVYASTSAHKAPKQANRGEYSWHELAADDYRAAFEFYSALFGWEEAGEHDMGGPNGVYFMFGLNGTAIGGIFNRMPEMPPPAWTGYVRVKDVQKAVKKVKSAGGNLVMGPMEVPGGDWVAQFTDAQGAMFAVHTLAADLGGAQSAPGATDVTPEETGAQRQEEAAEAAEGDGRDAVEQSGKRAKKVARVAPQKSAKKPAKKGSKKAQKKTQKKAAKSATRSRTAKKAAKKKATKTPTKKVTKKAKSSSKRRPPARTAKRSAKTAGKARRGAQQRSAKKGAKRARRAK